MRPISAAFVCVSGTELSKSEADFLYKYNPVGLTIFKRNIQNPTQLKKLTSDIYNAVGRDDFLIAIDQEGGPVRRMRPPHWHEYIGQKQIATLQTADAERLTYLQATLISNDLHNVGINVNFSPVADTAHKNTSYILTPRCFSTNPTTVSHYANILSDTYIMNGICPCIKHLPGHGLAQSDPHIGLSKIDASIDKLKQDWSPFQTLSKTVPLGMTAHIIISKIDKKPITQSSRGIDIIRKEIGFDGFLLSDAIEMHALSGTLVEKTEQSINAGCDAVCFCSGHNQNNPFIIEENIAVLKTAKFLSDKSLERLERINQIINTKYTALQNIKTLQDEYDVLVSKTKEIPIQPRDATENWSDNIYSNLCNTR